MLIIPTLPQSIYFKCVCQLHFTSLDRLCITSCPAQTLKCDAGTLPSHEWYLYAGRKSIAMLAWMTWWGFAQTQVQEFVAFRLQLQSRVRASETSGFNPRHYDGEACATCKTELTMAMAWKVSATVTDASMQVGNGNDAMYCIARYRLYLRP
jgi:hypothetical protein